MEREFKFLASDSSELLGMGSVQDDLKLGVDQKLRAMKLTADVFGMGTAIATSSEPLAEKRNKRQQFDDDYRKKVSEFLRPEQLERLDQIALQREFFIDAANFLLQSSTAEKLLLDPSQKSRLRALAERAKRELFRPYLDYDFRTVQIKYVETIEQQRLAALAELTPEQKLRLEELHGKFFDWATEFQQPKLTVFRPR